MISFTTHADAYTRLASMSVGTTSVTTSITKAVA